MVYRRFSRGRTTLLPGSTIELRAGSTLNVAGGASIVGLPETSPASTIRYSTVGLTLNTNNTVPVPDLSVAVLAGKKYRVAFDVRYVPNVETGVGFFLHGTAHYTGIAAFGEVGYVDPAVLDGIPFWIVNEQAGVGNYAGDWQNGGATNALYPQSKGARLVVLLECTQSGTLVVMAQEGAGASMSTKTIVLSGSMLEVSEVFQ